MDAKRYLIVVLLGHVSVSFFLSLLYVICVCIHTHSYINTCIFIDTLYIYPPGPLVDASFSVSFSALVAACLSHCVVEFLGSSLSLATCGVISACPWVPAVQTGYGFVDALVEGHLAFHLLPTSHPLQGGCFCRQSMWVNSEISLPCPSIAWE